MMLPRCRFGKAVIIIVPRLEIDIAGRFAGLEGEGLGRPFELAGREDLGLGFLPGPVSFACLRVYTKARETQPSEGADQKLKVKNPFPGGAPLSGSRRAADDAIRFSRRTPFFGGGAASRTF